MLTRTLVALGAAAERARISPLALKAYGMAFALSWFQGLFGAFDDAGQAARVVARRDPAGRADPAASCSDPSPSTSSTWTRPSSARRAGRRWTGGIVVTPNVDHLMLYGREQGFASLYDRADLVLADGMPLVLVARMLFLPLRHKVSGADFIRPLMGAAARHGLRVFLLGIERRDRWARRGRDCVAPIPS